jgi:hypothetical protein
MSTLQAQYEIIKSNGIICMKNGQINAYLKALVKIINIKSF